MEVPPPFVISADLQRRDSRPMSQIAQSFKPTEIVQLVKTQINKVFLIEAFRLSFSRANRLVETFFIEAKIFEGSCEVI